MTGTATKLIDVGLVGTQNFVYPSITPFKIIEGQFQKDIFA
jgi:hypothetical protein